MKELGLKVNPRCLAADDHTSSGGATAMQALLALKDRPAAVLCSNDLTAIGAMHCAYETQVKIPQDLSVVGFDNIWLSEFMIPPLTTVQMSQTEHAEVALNALLVEVRNGRSTRRKARSLCSPPAFCSGPAPLRCAHDKFPDDSRENGFCIQ